MSENEAKHCFLRSLSYWSHKTLESNMSQRRMRAVLSLLPSYDDLGTNKLTTPSRACTQKARYWRNLNTYRQKRLESYHRQKEQTTKT